MENNTLSPTEYERRRGYYELIKTMPRHEHIEIARLLQNNNVKFSENRQGIFFDVAAVPQDVFEKLVQFHDFVMANTAELEKRTA